MIFIQMLVVAAAAVILFQSISIINRMNLATNHGIRAAYVLIAAGSFGEISAILNGHIPGIAEILFVAGFGTLSFLDRRLDWRCPYAALERHNE